MKVFENSALVMAPIKAVADFHHDSRVLRRLTPLPVVVQLNRAGPVSEGSEADFVLWFGPLPVRWVAIHTAFDRLSGFTDRQETGPFAHWVHRHSFVPEGKSATRVLDHIEYEHRPGLYGVLTRILFSRFSLRVLFAYRNWVTRRSLESDGLQQASVA
jgi:ligand-binding SRPBCC domain-containing protein